MDTEEIRDPGFEFVDDYPPEMAAHYAIKEIMEFLDKADRRLLKVKDVRLLLTAAGVLNDYIDQE